ncbi:hypothetical protein NDU88_003486 [Pleurodeles waltl]|uniref:Uncharacterized protein n=1 Tax=Pleurodeles waltl TaxID=8319 RepID=A0AAV7KYL0_PLEWA|nr:hypothetical protein NDU88_003486 [Pleurodeles waltl]
MKNQQSREGQRTTEEQRTAALTEGAAKPNRNKKMRRWAAERTSQRPRRRNVNPPQPRFRRSVAHSGMSEDLAGTELTSEEEALIDEDLF